MTPRADGQTVVDVRLTLLNGSSDPFHFCRVKITAAEVTWGPQLVGTLAPGAIVDVRVQLLATTADIFDANAWARVTDANGGQWIVDVRGSRVADTTEGRRKWIEEGAAFASLDLTPEQRGTVTGVAVTADQ